MSSTQSVLLYGAEVWTDALGKEVYRKRLPPAQRRGALRVASAYRTVSEPALMVIAGVILVALLIQHSKTDYFLTQFLSFQSYLQKIGKARSPDFVFCNASHFFSCGRWDGIRQQLYLNTGDLSPDSIVEEMLRSADR